MKIGIFFGGQSREREVSFAGGRTVYDNLNKNIFEAIPIFVDSLGNFILLEWQYIYKGTIRDFYPPAAYQPKNFQIYIDSLAHLNEEEFNQLISQVGKKIQPQGFKKLIDFAFLALHGPYGEDGNLQGLLEWYNIPYSGCGILPSAIGISKSIQAELLKNLGFNRPKSVLISKEEWQNTPYKGDLLENLTRQLGLPFVIKAPHQGSSIGVSVLTEKDNQVFVNLVNKAFFIQELGGRKWKALTDEGKIQWINQLIDIREGIGFPLEAQYFIYQEQEFIYQNQQIIDQPEILLEFLNKNLKTPQDKIVLTALQHEEEVLLEGFIFGKEFSCIVVQDEKGEAIALPPTEIIKTKDVFDYRAKYLPGISRKITPIDVPSEHLQTIRQECCRMFKQLHAQVYMRIDGFVNGLGQVFLNDPNTTSGMLPSSFFFHQAAEIGLNPSQFLTYIIRTSLQERIKSGKNNFILHQNLKKLDETLHQLHQITQQKIKVGIIMGGFSTERHISVESGRNIYEKLASSAKYEPIPIFLVGNENEHQLYIIPIRMMLKDNADDIRDKILNAKEHPMMQTIRDEANPITQKYAQNAIVHPQIINYEALAKQVDFIFIALHGRPGEDGEVQKQLEMYDIPYNGSGVQSSKITINKYETNEILQKNGINVAKHQLVYKKDWQKDAATVVKDIEQQFAYPLIAKPADDGCSSAVKKIKNQAELVAFAQMMFRENPSFLANEAQVLNLKSSEEFPQKNYFLLEALITANGAKHFLEITGGLITKYNAQEELVYEMFEPSETLAIGDILSLEEKFLAGEGQNITPARFTKDAKTNQYISDQVKEELKKVAQILHIEGYARIDAFVRIYENNRIETIVIEANSLPGMTPATCIFHQAAINQYKPYDFIEAIIKFGMERSEKRLIK